MPTTSLRNLLLAGLVASTLVIAACSSSDSGGDSSTPADDDSGQQADAGQSDADQGDGGASAATITSCDQLISTADVEALFGEAAQVEEQDGLTNNESLGQTTCTWTTTEGDDVMDGQLLVVQWYSGDPIPGGNFYDPDLTYPGWEPADVGDESFVYLAGNGVTVGFLQGDAFGSVSWSAIDIDQSGPTAEEKKAEVIDFTKTYAANMA